MPIPPVLVILAVIALVLHILFNYILWPAPDTWPRYHRPYVAITVIILILIFWFVLPIRVGN